MFNVSYCNLCVILGPVNGDLLLVYRKAIQVSMCMPCMDDDGFPGLRIPIRCI